MRVLIAGARGYIGSAASSTLRAGGCDVLPLASSPCEGFGWLDLGNPRSFGAIPVREGDFVLLLGGISSPDACAREPERVRRINVEGTIEFISSCMIRGARVIFFSSDTVYGERAEEFDESAGSNPAGEYALMKYEVESRFLGNAAFKTARLSYVFSREDKFTTYLLGCAERGQEADIFDPFCRAVVHRDDVVQGATALMRRWDEFAHPVINLGGPDVIARAEFAQILKGAVMPALRYRRVEPGSGFFLNRPRVIRMKSRLLASLLERPPRSLSDAARVEFSLEGQGKNA
jgi:nucleoside-diphosphate-sugar epimerase